jgi:hypothetical protein
MTDTPSPAGPAQPFAPLQDLPRAPIVYFEYCPTIGNNTGLINITLATGIVLPTAGTATEVVPVAVAHLRCGTAAAIQLRDAISAALLIGTPVDNPQGKSN